MTQVRYDRMYYTVDKLACFLSLVRMLQKS